MTKNRKIIACLLLLCMTLVHATESEKAPSPKVTSARFSNGLTIEFNEPMLTWIGSSAPEGISISPDLPCKWSWSNDSELTCDTPYGAEGPRPAKRYHIAIKGGLWSQSGVEIAAQDITAESARPKIESAGIESWNAGNFTIELWTNVPIAPADLRAAIDLNLDGRPIEFQLDEATRWSQSQSMSQQWRLRPVIGSQSGTLSLSARPGLRAIGGELLGESQPPLLRAFVNEPFRLRRFICADNANSGGAWEDATQGEGSSAASISPQCAAGSGANFAFSSALDRSALDALRNSLPRGLRLGHSSTDSMWRARSGGEEELKEGFIVQVIATEAGKTFDFEFPATLRSDGATALGRTTHVSLRTTDFHPSFNVAPVKMLSPIGEAAQPSVLAVNEPHLDVYQREIGAGEALETKDAIGVRERNEKKKIKLPEAKSEVTRNGGFVSGRVKERVKPNAWYTSNTYGVAYAAFNISASKAGSQFLVWVTHWKGATGVAGAKIELLHFDKKETMSIVASATTDAAGIAVFNRLVGSTDDGDDFNFLIRATQGKRVAIAPLRDTLKSARGGSYGVDDGTEQLAWGISDRPLYRPGETVRYRVWIRKRYENRLLARSQKEVVSFSIGSPSGDTSIDRFDVNLDRFGSASGEFRLPQTLKDNYYCIGPNASYSLNGACFRVTGYHVNDMWAELHADRTTAREGDVVEFVTTGGYFSGGQVANARTELQTLLTPQRLEDAYPKYREYTFIDPFESTQGSGGESFEVPQSLKTDAQGRIAVRLKLENPKLAERLAEDKQKPIPFGLLEVTASVSTSGANAVSSAPASLRFSRYPRFVGIKIEPWLLRADSDPQISAIVIDETGKEVGDAKVHVDVEEATSKDFAGPATKLAHCDIPSGVPSACAFRPPHSGRYRFRATSDGAASADLERYAFTDSHWVENNDKDRAHLSVSDNHIVSGANIDMVLEQPFAKARVLFSIEHGHILKHWVQDIDSPVAKISLPVPHEWKPGVTVHALILDAADEAFGKNAPKGSLVETASVDLHVSTEKQPESPSLTVDREKVRPGDEITIRLHNPAATERQMTVAVVDDAARNMAPDLASSSDPANSEWLGKLESWNVTAWYGLGDWPRAAEVGPDASLTGRVDIETANPSLSLEPQSMSLESIVVTGSRINPADIFVRNPSTDRSLRPSPRGSNLTKASVRTHFAESALWETDITLAAGAERTVRVHLPDNLTRWRILAWSNDQDDAFSLAQATVEAALPLELRTEIPTRLFPGDRATLAASVRNHGDVARVVSARLEANGGGTKVATAWQGGIGSNTEKRLTLLSTPNAIGNIEVDAQAGDNNAADSIAGLIEVASPSVHQRVPVAGWLQKEGLRLKLPGLPAGATHARLRVEAGRGLIALANGWAKALRDYPHRCWEQILSRAVGAAAAKRLGIAPTGWPDADNVVAEALHSAGQYQDSNGQFRFFAGQYGQEVSSASPFLTAYTIRSFAFLRSLGYTIPATVEKSAKGALAQTLALPDEDESRWRDRGDELASLLASTDAGTSVRQQLFDDLWNKRSKLRWSSRADLALALARRSGSADRSGTLLAEMRSAGVKHGTRRVIEESSGTSWWPFGSRTIDQCAVAAVLAKLDHSPGAEITRDEFLRGIADLYAGGAPPMDTQANARCLMSLVETAPAWGADQPVNIAVSGIDSPTNITLAPNQSSNSWDGRLPPTSTTIELNAIEGADAFVSVVANIEYDIDGRAAQPSAVGFSIERSYSVLRDRQWKAVPAVAIREGDWVRVALRIHTKDLRRFVAITDTVAGGMRPADLELSGVSDIDLRHLASGNSPYFGEQQIDDRYARFYAEVLPPGSHEVSYYARAAYTGSYAALPAVAELMYGSSSIARTSTMQIHVERPTK